MDAVVATLYGLTAADFAGITEGCDIPTASSGRLVDNKGFWRIDGASRAELRLPVLAQSAFADLTRVIDAANAPEVAMYQFLGIDGGGWPLPETLRLADHGLGHDDRAMHHQPVAAALGPRFYDWQLSRPAEEANRERNLHARNLLGELGYARLLASSSGRKHTSVREPLREVADERAEYEAGQTDDEQPDIFE